MKKVVVLGAGFGGLRTAALLAKKLRSLHFLGKYEVVLVDRNEHQTYTPLLYEIATTSKETANISGLHNLATYKISSLIGKLPITFVQAEIVSMDPIEGDVHLSNDTELCADFLVVALGSETNYFGMPGLREHAMPLKSFRDAVALRDTVLNLIQDGRKEIKIVIGGGGATGVELAGELKAWCGELEKNHICKLRVLIIEGQPSILAGLHAKVVSLATQRLKKMGVEILSSKRVVSTTSSFVTLDDGKTTSFDVLIWAGGIKSPDVLSKLPLHAESHGKPVAESGMECLPQTPNLKLHSKVYGLGDSVCFYDPKTQKPIPAVARAALVQADVVAHNVIEEIKKTESTTYNLKPKTYVPREYPYIVPVGGKYAIAKIGPFVISGFCGWIIKGFVELNYLLSIMLFWKALKIWLKGLKIFTQNDRLG